MISVIIPCYNAERTIAVTIESVLSQTNSEFELLVVDDGSTDNSLSIIRDYEPKLRVLTGKNRGVSAARNHGISETSGTWIIFLDSDDLLQSGTLCARLGVAEKNDADVIFCNWQDISAGGQVDVLGTVRSVDTAALVRNKEIACATSVWMPPAAIMYRRDIVNEIGGFRLDLPVIQDARFLFDAAFRGARFAHSNHVGAYYLILPESLSRRDPYRFWRDVLTNGEQIEALWLTRGALSPEQKIALAEIYDGAARGLLAAKRPDYFEAVVRYRALGVHFPLYHKIAVPMARAFGVDATQKVMSRLGR